MAFIDADKVNLLACYERCHALVRTRGLILIDNTLWTGSVADDCDHDPSTKTSRAFNVAVHRGPRVRDGAAPDWRRADAGPKGVLATVSAAPARTGVGSWLADRHRHEAKLRAPHQAENRTAVQDCDGCSGPPATSTIAPPGIRRGPRSCSSCPRDRDLPIAVAQRQRMRQVQADRAPMGIAHRGRGGRVGAARVPRSQGRYPCG